MHVKNARLNARGLFAARTGYSCGLAILIFLFGSRALQNAVAEGDTRTISMHHLHTGEDITITYKRDGRYDESALEKLNWFLRDWRRAEQTKMDPHLIDLVWEVQREASTQEPIQVVCGYRSPQTNAMLRRSSHGVARFSQHMLGHAMDFSIPGIPLEHLREIGLRLQRGGVGFYPESGSPFVHMDTGDVRMWPRMTHEELARVFPDGRTVLIPSDGKPLPGYALALAEIKKQGGAPSDNSLDAARDAGIDVGPVVASNERSGNPFAKLLGLAREDDDEDAGPSLAIASAATPAETQYKPPVHVPLPMPSPVRSASAKSAPAATANEGGAKLVDDASLVHVAGLVPLPSAPPAPSAPAASAQLPQNQPPPNQQSANQQSVKQVISARGYWEGPPDGMAVINPTPARPSRRPTAANGNSDTPGLVGPFGDPRVDRVAPELAYAEQPRTQARTVANSIVEIRPAALTEQTTSDDQAAETAVPNGTTIVIKRLASQAASAVMTTGASTIVTIKTGIRLENPWMRAVVLAPSVHRFLTTLALGTRDFRTLAALMVKPRRSVMMTFAADPNPGLDHDRFSGAAVVFVSTVNYPARTEAF
ncbi:MAG: DUF882 domain-containing protein [Xanthobacteraceae bacterium]